MKRKKRRGGGGANWMDTYGDMVTLLLCFFVLLYSMSTISEENWKALVMSFNPSAVMAVHETSGDEGPVAEDTDGKGLEEGMTQAQVDAEMEQLFEALSQFAAESQSQMNGTISVTKEGGKVYISFSDTVFFAGDSPILLEEAYPVLDKVSGMLSAAAPAIDEVRVLGHTAQGNPNKPNSVKVDRTLSSQRATNVIIYIQENSTIDPARLISEGIGQWRPVATNQTPEGRAQNRRVEMVISGRNLEAELNGDIQKYYT